MSYYAPQSRPVLKKAFQKALENGEPYDLELEFVRANKEKIWVRTMGRPEKKDEKVVKIKGNFIDITDFKHLSQRQERSLTLLEKVYESLDEAVFAVNPQDRRILSCNAASERIFGYSKNEMIGKKTEFLHVNKKAYKEYGKKFARALASGTEFHIEYNLKNKDGKVFPTEHIVKAVQDESGLPPIHVTFIRDMTFRKLAEKQLQSQREELKSRAQRLEELNAALKVLLDQREREKRDLETQLSERVNGLIIPTLNKMRDKNIPDDPKDLLDILEANINEITKPVHLNISSEMMSLSPAETTVADLIKLGYQTKEIASKMNISIRTVEFHRDNIRKKLNIKGRKVNLKTYLARIS
jgi:PAS domain S-box-containing protein